MIKQDGSETWLEMNANVAYKISTKSNQLQPSLFMPTYKCDKLF
jgi:hypothetical protein